MAEKITREEFIAKATSHAGAYIEADTGLVVQNGERHQVVDCAEDPCDFEKCQGWRLEVLPIGERYPSQPAILAFKPEVGHDTPRKITKIGFASRPLMARGSPTGRIVEHEPDLQTIGRTVPTGLARRTDYSEAEKRLLAHYGIVEVVNGMSSKVERSPISKAEAFAALYGLPAPAEKTIETMERLSAGYSTIGTKFASLVTEVTVNSDDEEYELPKYSDPGWIMFEIQHIYRDGGRENYEIEVINYDYGASPFWLGEGMGVEYFLTDVACIELDQEGIYIMEGVTGEYIKGEWGFTDDDEEWDFKTIRYATPEEIEGGVIYDDC